MRRRNMSPQQILKAETQTPRSFKKAFDDYNGNVPKTNSCKQTWKMITNRAAMFYREPFQWFGVFQPCILAALAVTMVWAIYAFESDKSTLKKDDQVSSIQLTLAVSLPFFYALNTAFYTYLPLADRQSGMR